MPRLDVEGSMETQAIPGSNFTYQATRIELLGATEYTLVEIVVDVSGSVYRFDDDLHQAILSVIDSCRLSPRSNNLLVRVTVFSTGINGGVKELHGFKLLSEITAADYPKLQPSGGTPLCDAAYDAVGAMTLYGNNLADNDFLANGLLVIITDGRDNASKATPAMVRRQIEMIRSQESLESIVGVLIGINAQYYRSELDSFASESGIDRYIDFGDATPASLAKMADFVSQSVSSQSQALGTGGPSQLISATI
jgi:hypothetical protein